VSASATVDVREQCAKAGADAFLAKPVDLPALLQLMSALLHLSWIDDSPEFARQPGHTRG